MTSCLSFVIAETPGASWPAYWQSTQIAPTSSSWRYRAVGFLSVTRSPTR